jgi:hypothetical protein
MILTIFLLLPLKVENNTAVPHELRIGNCGLLTHQSILVLVKHLEHPGQKESSKEYQCQNHGDEEF